MPTPCTSCNTLDGRWRTFSRLGVALWQSPRRRKRRLRVSWLLSLPCSPLRRHLGIAWHNKPQEICPGTGRYIVKLHTHFYPYSAFCLLQKLPIRGGLFIKNPTDIKGLLPYNPKHIDIANGYPSSKVQSFRHCLISSIWPLFKIEHHCHYAFKKVNTDHLYAALKPLGDHFGPLEEHLRTTRGPLGDHLMRTSAR